VCANTDMLYGTVESATATTPRKLPEELNSIDTQMCLYLTIITDHIALHVG